MALGTPEARGHVRGLGLGVTPTQFFDTPRPTSRKTKENQKDDFEQRLREQEERLNRQQEEKYHEMDERYRKQEELINKLIEANKSHQSWHGSYSTPSGVPFEGTYVPDPPQSTTHEVARGDFNVSNPPTQPPMDGVAGVDFYVPDPPLQEPPCYETPSILVIIV